MSNAEKAGPLALQCCTILLAGLAVPGLVTISGTAPGSGMALLYLAPIVGLCCFGATIAAIWLTLRRRHLNPMQRTFGVIAMFSAVSVLCALIFIA